MVNKLLALVGFPFPLILTFNEHIQSKVKYLAKSENLFGHEVKDRLLNKVNLNSMYKVQLCPPLCAYSYSVCLKAGAGRYLFWRFC